VSAHWADSRKRWAKAHPEKVYALTVAWRKNNPEKWRAQVKRMLARKAKRQEEIAGRPRPTICEVCWQPGQIVFDHNHKTGEFRGWICADCNKTLGNSRESVERLLLLARYLQ
jgi:RNase P subunit RPR2